MLFVTNRTVKEGLDPEVGTKINFGKDADEAGGRDEKGISRSILFCRRSGPGDYQVVGSKAFFPELRDCDKRQILIYIHGYSNTDIEATFTDQALKLQELFDQIDSKWIQVVPIMWPCEDDKGKALAYWDDQRTAKASVLTVQRMLDFFRAWQDQQRESGEPVCRKWINLAAHSMGNRLLMYALSGYEDEGASPPRVFRSIFMHAADVRNEILEKGRTGGAIPRACRNLVVYYADDDLAMSASKAANLRNGVLSRRLGHTGPESWAGDVLSSNVYAADCSNFNNTYENPNGHAYFLEDDQGNPGSAFLHMADALWRGRVHVGDNTGRLIELPKHNYVPPAAEQKLW